MREPVSVESYVGNANHAADRTFKGFACKQIFDRRACTLSMHVKIEDFFPHRNEEAQVALLAGVLLRNLNLHCFVAVLKCAKQRRDRFARLEVNRPVLDLQHNVVIELAVERMEDVVGGAGTVGL